jgi:DNA polymerase III delta prime subunit
MQMATTSLWVEKYRPNTIDSYVFRDQQQKNQIDGWIKQQSIPHLLFSGSAGIGKTTLAKVLFNELDIEPLDILEINGSRTNSVDDVRNLITNFVQMIPFGDFKVVLLDEADYLSVNAQAALRGVMEEYHNTARFLLTCNYPHKIIPAIHSRCQGFHIEKVDIVEFTARVATILVEENVDFDLDTLDTFVKATYPDLRKCINTVQMNSLSGTLTSPSYSDTGSGDYKVEMVELFKAGKISDARKLLCSQARPEEMEEIYRWLYSNLNYLGTNERQQDKAILIIKQGLVDHTICADSEINLAAVLIRLAHNLES